MIAGLFALGAALIAAAGSAVTAVIRSSSKKKAAEAEAIRAAAAAKNETRRLLYDRLISAAPTAAGYITGNWTSLSEGDGGPTNFAQGIRLVLSPVRNAAEGIEADGSDDAKAIATTLLAGISDLWEQASANAATYPEDVLTKANEALTKGRAEMIATKRKDLG
jgi:hypothetical protein